MPTPILWDASPSMTTVISTDLNSWADSTLKLSSEIDLTASLKPYISLSLYIASFGSAPAAGAYVNGWFLYAKDGTNYEDGGTSVTPPRPPDFTIPVRAVATAQRLSPAGQIALVAPFKMKILVESKTGQTAAASGNTLSYGLFADESQ